MARRISVKLKTHRASGRFYKTIGCALGRDGQPKKKTWYFDPDDNEALSKVLDLKARWRALRAAGKSVWDEDATYLAERTSVPANGAADDARETPSKALTVDDAARLYLSHMEQRMQAGQIGRQHYASQSHRLTKALEPLAKLPLSMMGGRQLQDAVLKLVQRPHVAKPTAKGKTTRTVRMSPTYSRACLASLKWFCQWCDESEQVNWTKPRAFRTIFKAQPALDPEEHERELSDEVDHFTVDELAKLWTEASDFQRTLILLGLNCGFANAECASLRKSEMKGSKIERYRVKTIKTAGRGSYGRWNLWSETKAHLARNLAPDNERQLALLNANGKPLIQDFAEYRQDEICHQWQRLVQRAKVRPLSFKYLRKTAAHFVRVTLGYGSDVAEMMLAHADAGMIRKYSGRDWDKLDGATRKMRVLLTPMFGTSAEVLNVAA